MLVEHLPHPRRREVDEAMGKPLSVPFYFLPKLGLHLQVNNNEKSTNCIVLVSKEINATTHQ